MGSRFPDDGPDREGATDTHLCNPAEDVFLLRVLGPSVPPTLLTVEWITAFSAFLKTTLDASGDLPRGNRGYQYT